MANAVLLRRKMQNKDREPGTNQGTIWRMKQTSRLLIRTRAQGLLWRNHWNHQSSLVRVKMTTWIKGFWEELHNKCITRELLKLWSPASESQPLRFSLPSAAPRQEEAACPPTSSPKAQTSQFGGSDRRVCALLLLSSQMPCFLLTSLFKDFPNWIA